MVLEGVQLALGQQHSMGVCLFRSTWAAGGTVRVGPVVTFWTRSGNRENAMRDAMRGWEVMFDV